MQSPAPGTHLLTHAAGPCFGKRKKSIGRIKTPPLQVARHSNEPKCRTPKLSGHEVDFSVDFFLPTLNMPLMIIYQATRRHGNVSKRLEFCLLA
jgi:hypothetical protein